MQKNTTKKMLALLVVLMLLIGIVAGGTIAWLMTSTEELVNTFVAGEIKLTLTEPSFPESKTLKFLPGDSFKKDPTVTVEAGSVPCYVRTFMVIWWEEKADDNFNAEDGKDWFYLDDEWRIEENKWWLAEDWYDNTGDENKDGKGDVLGIVMEYRWMDKIDASAGDVVLPPLFSGVNVPANLTTEQYLSLNNFKITLFAQAVQAEGITDQNGDGVIDANDAFATEGITYPDFPLEHCGSHTYAEIRAKLLAQDVPNDMLDKEQSGE